MFGAPKVQFRPCKMKTGAAWHVQVDGRLKRRIRGFSSEAEARDWIRSKSAQWLVDQDQDLRLEPRTFASRKKWPTRTGISGRISLGQAAAFGSRAVVSCRHIEFEAGSSDGKSR